MSDDERVYLQDHLTGWHRASKWEASQIFVRLFAVFNVVHVTVDSVWSGNADFKAAFVNSLVAAAVLAPLSMIFKVMPMFDE